MFAYIVKRLLASVLVLVIVSMSIFLLFFYGPEAPARPVCDAQTSNRCTAGAAGALHRAAGLQQLLVSASTAPT